jgi:hypothetical protein
VINSFLSQSPLLKKFLGQVQEEYTTDGSLDFDGNPALKHRTGGWRGCRSILGKLLLPVEMDFNYGLISCYFRLFSKTTPRAMLCSI